MLHPPHPTYTALHPLRVLAAVCACSSPVTVQSTSPPKPPSAAILNVEVAKVAGLRQEANILVDRWGVPHIYAASRDDAFFVQGYNAARDRLFQIDLWRRRGLGRLASVFGPSFVEQDKAARLFLYRGDMLREWQAYGRDAQSIAERFVAGINAYIDYVLANPKSLPFEFRRFDYTPEKWHVQDVVRIRSHGLSNNLNSEVHRAHVTCHAGLKTDAMRLKLTPDWETRIPDGLDPCLPKDVLKVFHLATKGVSLPASTPPSHKSDATDTLPFVANFDLQAPPEGSNAWVIAPAKTTTGRAILASDPHRAYNAPSLRYIAHLNAPRLNVIGAGEPSLPGISIGHNGSIAFGLTIFSIDQEDLYVYETHPENPTHYKYQGKWEKFVSLRESIPIKGTSAAEVDLRFTRHGPVIYQEDAKNRAFAVRSGWLEPGMAPYFGSINYMFATNFQEFKMSMARWGTPAENQVYADTQGNIGWATGGLAPIRPNWDGLLPVPGDGRFEWAGFLDGTQLPSAFNPQTAWLASANEMNLPADYPYKERKLGFEWPGSDRYNRLSEVLSQPGKLSINDSLRLQNDVLSLPARRAVGLLVGLQSDNKNTQAALALLRKWDFHNHADSAAAALFEIWWSRYLGYLFKEVALPKAAAATMGPPDTSVLLGGLEHPQPFFGAEALAKRDWVLLTSLNLAWTQAEKMLGTNPTLWQWGKLHHALIAHPLAAAVDATTRAKLNIGPFAKQGSASTPNMSSYDPRDFRQTGGPSFRVVLDVGNWDNSRAINTPGQSGDPDSPHYRDLVGMWLKGEYFPLLYTRKSVEADTVRRIVLQPN